MGKPGRPSAVDQLADHQAKVYKETPAGDELMSSQMVAERLDVSIRTLWRLVKAQKFPAPIRFNRKLVKWKRSEVEAFFAALANGQTG